MACKYLRKRWNEDKVGEIGEVQMEHVCEVTILCDNAPTEEERKMNRSAAYRTAENVKQKLLSGLWGALEGMMSGTLIGLSVTGEGWWLFGAVSQLIGGVTGFTVGTLSGTVIGVISGDRKTIAQTMKDYRWSFGDNATNVPSVSC